MIEAISETICIHYILTYIHVYTEEITTIYTYASIYEFILYVYIVGCTFLDSIQHFIRTWIHLKYIQRTK